MRKTEGGILEQIVLYATSILLVFFLGWIFIHASGKIPLAKNIFKGNMYRIILPGVGLFIMVMLFLTWKVSKLQEKYLKAGIGFLGCLIVLLQFLYLYYVRVYVNYDNLLVLNQAVEMQTTGKIDPSFFNEYFLRYPHNYPMVILMYYVLRLAGSIGFTNVYWTAAAFGLLCMDVALTAGAGIVRKMYGWKPCFIYMAFCVCNPVVYVWIPWYYTTLSAMPFFIAGIYFVVCAGKAESIKKQIICGIFAGAALGLGIRIRVTAAIFLIALIICGIAGEYWKKKGIRYFIAAMGIFLAVTWCACGQIQKKYVDFDCEDKAFPVTHYIMMGLGGEGTFKPEDLAFTQSFDGKEEKIEANLEEAHRRFKKMGWAGFVKLLGRKLVITWHDGSMGFQDRWMNEIQPSDGYLYLIGEKNDIFLAYMQIYYVMSLLLMILGTVGSLIKKRTGMNLILRLTLLGTIIFFMFWEAQNRYSLFMTFVFTVLSLDGLFFLVRGFGKISEKYGKPAAKIGVGCGMGVLAVIFGVVLYQPVFRQSISYCDYSVRNMYSVGENLKNITEHDVIEQSFATDRPFNTVYISGGFADNGSAQGGCLLEIRDGEESTVASRELTGEEIAAGQIMATFDTVMPAQKTEYTIRISPRGITAENPMYLQRFNGAIDIYPDGRLTRGTEGEKGDLIFSVYQNKQGKYF